MLILVVIFGNQVATEGKTVALVYVVRGSPPALGESVNLPPKSIVQN